MHVFVDFSDFKMNLIYLNFIKIRKSIETIMSNLEEMILDSGEKFHQFSAEPSERKNQEILKTKLNKTSETIKQKLQKTEEKIEPKNETLENFGNIRLDEINNV